jgi:hypothetical protein
VRLFKSSFIGSDVFVLRNDGDEVGVWSLMPTTDGQGCSVHKPHDRCHIDFYSQRYIHSQVQTESS